MSIPHCLDGSVSLRVPSHEEADRLTMSCSDTTTAPLYSGNVGRAASAVVLVLSAAFAPAQTLHLELIEAATTGDTAVLEEWLGSGLEPNLKDSEGWTALMHASRHGHVAAVRTLLEHGALPDVRGGRAPSALELARSQRHSDVVSVLQRTLDEDGAPGRFLTAARNGDLAAVRALLDDGISVNVVGRDGRSALFHAAWDGHLDVVRALFDAGLDRDRIHRVLGSAASRGHHQVVRVLVDAGADVNARDSYGFTPLMSAARFGHAEAVAILVDAGIPSGSPQAEAALGWAALHGHAEAVRELAQAGVDLESHAVLGFSPLFHAVMKGNIDLVVLLLEAGADVEAMGGRMRITALEQAENSGRDEIAELLRRHSRERR